MRDPFTHFGISDITLRNSSQTGERADRITGISGYNRSGTGTKLLSGPISSDGPRAAFAQAAWKVSMEFRYSKTRGAGLSIPITGRGKQGFFLIITGVIVWYGCAATAGPCCCRLPAKHSAAVFDRYKPSAGEARHD